LREGSQLSRGQGLQSSKSAAQFAVSWLIKRKLLAASKENATAVPRYAVLVPWKDSTRRATKSHDCRASIAT
jgi:hypothetical protein